MRSNLKMQTLLERFGLDTSKLLLSSSGAQAPRLEKVDDCVFLEQELRRSRGVALNQFPDRTGMECFVNHVHFQIGRSKRALEQVFGYVAALSESLKGLHDGSFQIILTVSNGVCIVRFHKCRQGEEWLANDLEGYKAEAIFVLTVQPADSETCASPKLHRAMVPQG